MNVNLYNTTDYKIFIPLAGQKNKPNSNPIKPNLQKAKMNINSIITKDYRKKDDFAVRKNKPNSNPISEKPKMNVNLYVIEDYENETAFRPQKNKPNQTQFQNRSPMPVLRGQISVFCLLFSVFCPRRLLIDPMLPLYKLSNVQYYSRSKGRCSSMVERSFRKAEVVGPTPTIGFGPYCRCLLAAMDVRTGKEIRFRFGSSEDKAGKEAKRRTTGW